MTNAITVIHHTLEDGNRLVGEIWIEPDVIEWRKARGRKAYRITLKDFKDLIEKHGKEVKPRG